MHEKSDDESDNKFTFSVEGKKYVINEKHIPEKNQSKKNLIHGPSIGIGASITAVCVFIVFFSLKGLDNIDQELIEKEITEVEYVQEPIQITRNTFIKNGSPILGNPNALITLVEFGDYQCHFCNVHFHNTQNKLLENYIITGDVNFIFKDFVIIGPDSFNAAHAAHCANEDQKYWEYHHILYSNWTGENNGWASKQNLEKYADAIKIDIQKFSECMNSNRYSDIINQSNNDANILGITGTPAFFIVDNTNDRVDALQGAQPYEIFEKVIDSILEK